MICPYCGNENSDEHIYCESCGKEFQIVPDYDYEIEEHINDAMNESVQELKEDSNEDDSFEDEYFLEEDPNLIESVYTKFKGKKLVIIAVVSVFLLLVSFVAYRVIHHYQVNNYDYQISHAKQAISVGNFGEAIEYLENALLYDDSNDQDKMLLANCFIKSENYDAAIMILREMIAENPSNVEAYNKIISIYELNEEYEKIESLLADCSDETVLSGFMKYVALEPAFNMEEGTYHEVQFLSLTANSNGTIYYTLDGTLPDESSLVYTAPISFESSGIFTVSAIFINDYGVSSDIVTKKFTIDLIEPEAPVVSLESGIYDLPQLITIDVPSMSSVYYTIDGDVPNDTSLQYTGPFYLQLGTHVYQFVTYSHDGVPGAVTTCYYTLSMNTLFSPEKALEMSRQFICNYGFTTDIQGHVAGKAGHNEYICNTAFIYNETPFYLIVEKYVDTLGTSISTGNLYAFDANDTRFYHAYLMDDGSYTVEPILVE